MFDNTGMILRAEIYNVLLPILNDVIKLSLYGL